MQLHKVDYQHLNVKQKENFNFQKIAAVLAEYGFNCIKLADDWNGADFLAYHVDGLTTLRVQLKSRLTVAKKYQGKEIVMAFPMENQWCFIEHDVLFAIVAKTTPSWLLTRSWLENGKYGVRTANRALREQLQGYLLEPATAALAY